MFTVIILNCVVLEYVFLNKWKCVCVCVCVCMCVCGGGRGEHVNARVCTSHVRCPLKVVSHTVRPVGQTLSLG